MNRQQKEVQQAFLNSEKDVLKKLTNNYADAINEIDTKIAILQGRKDADLQHVIYQIEYQKALKEQVNTILEQLHNNNFETLSEYLTASYEDGFIGTLYDLQGQGIPLVFPIDQEQIVAAIQHETKLSESLYAALGKDTKVLSKQIAGEISRGISNASMYSEMARNISSYCGISKNKAMRIARTEAHRIQCKATADVQKKAKAKGADIVKQWDATLDGKTRSTHRQLDGQIRELEDPFEVAGMEAMEPGGFGIASEDCNCRCALLQRARWALGNEYTKWSPDAPVEISDDGTTQLVKIKAKNYEDFTNKYWKAIDDGSVGLSVPKMKSDFIPAKTVDEAEEYAKKFVVEKTWSGNGNVSFKGISVESANKINETLTNLYAQNDIPLLYNIQPMNFRANIWKGSEKVPMAYRNMQSGELYFNPKIMKNAKTVASYMDEGREAYTICKENIDKFTGSNRQLIETYLKAGRSLVAEDCDDVIKALTEHEMGHHIENQVICRSKEMVAVVKDGFDEYATKISGYATKTHGEYIAESFAAFKNGQSDRIDPELKSIFEKLSTKDGIASLTKNDKIESVKIGTSSLETLQLPKQEYAHVMSEINTHMNDAQRNQAVVSKAIGDYIYTFENHGFDNYRIIGKVPIDKGKYDEIEKLFNE